MKSSLAIATATLSLVPLLALPLWAAASPASHYCDPPDEHHPWCVHDHNRPQPAVVTPGTFSCQEQPGRPPSDAIVLFDGKDLSNWESVQPGGGPARWRVKDGMMEVAPRTGHIRTKEEFGDCQLHIEWSELPDISGAGQARGNSGIFLMGLVEIQVLDSYHNRTYADGHAASVYGVNPPMVNALRPPGQFQVYDIVFRRPIYKDGKQLDPGYVTVFVNGVLVQDHTPLEGPTGNHLRAHPVPFPEKGPLKLQDHKNVVRYRNIWYRPLPPRPVEGGTDGYLSIEATMAKRKETAANIRQDALKLKDPVTPAPEMLRLAESLIYEKDASTTQTVTAMANQYVEALRALSSRALRARKREVMRASELFGYLTHFGMLPASFPAAAELQQTVKQQHWDQTQPAL